MMLDSVPLVSLLPCGLRKQCLSFSLVNQHESPLTRVFNVQFREAANEKDDAALLKIMSSYGMQCHGRCSLITVDQDELIFRNIAKNYKFLIAGEEVVTALGSEVDRLEKEIQYLVPGIRHVDIEAHNPTDLFP